MRRPFSSAAINASKSPISSWSIVHFVVRILICRSQQSNLSAVSLTSELFQGLLCSARKSTKLSEHRIDYISRVAFCVNTINIPLPRRRVRLEPRQAVLLQFRDELDREERIPPVFS